MIGFMQTLLSRLLFVFADEVEIAKTTKLSRYRIGSTYHKNGKMYEVTRIKPGSFEGTLYGKEYKFF